MKKNLLTLFFTLSWLPVFSCSCSSAGNFIKATKKADIIALIKVEEYQDFFTLTGAGPDSINQPLSAKVEVIQLLQGNEERKEIKIYGDNGILCRPYIDALKKGGYYVVGLYKGQDIEQEEDYIISICGEFWIEYNQTNETVKGLIKENRRRPKTYLYSELKELLAKR